MTEFFFRAYQYFCQEIIAQACLEPFLRYASKTAAFSLVSKAKYASIFQGRIQMCAELLRHCVLRRYPPSVAQGSSSAKAMEDKFTGILRQLHCTTLIFASKKKSTDGIPDGLPSVALAKDGGGRTNLSYGISTLKQVKLF